MSDGPYKTLPMRKGWKRLVKNAYRDASSDGDVAEALPAALLDDCREEFSDALVRGLGAALASANQMQLFDEQVPMEHLRVHAAGLPFAQSLLDCASDVLRQKRGEEEVTIAQVLAQALEERALRGARQAEEHCKREANASRAAGMRGRLERAISGTSFMDIAAAFLRKAPVQSPKRHDGLDDGVGLP